MQLAHFRKLIFMLVALTGAGWAQTAALTANVHTLAGGTAVPGVKVRFELRTNDVLGNSQVGCGPGNLPRVVGGGGTLLNDTIFDYTPNGAGLVTGQTIYRTDSPNGIDCAGLGTFTTYYWVYIVNGGSKRFYGQYLVNSATFNLNTAVQTLVVPTGSSTAGFVDVISAQTVKGYKTFNTCGLVGDGVANDGPALQSCINANQGRKIFLPKMQAIGSCDYNIGSTNIQPKGFGQIIEGEGGGWGTSGNTTLCKTTPDGIDGLTIVHSQCQNCTVRNLNIVGPSPWSSVTLTQNILPCTPPAGQSYAGAVVCDTLASTGVRVEGGFTTLENLYIQNWGRHGVYLTSDFGGFPDNFNLQNVTANDNRGDGFYCKGGDCNAGSSMQFHAYNNLMYGMDDQGFLGNAHYSPQLTGNHAAGTATGSTFSITAISRTTNVVTLTAAGHNFALGNVIVVAGVTDSSFNGTFAVSSVTSTTATYAQTAANASSSGGTGRLTSNNEFYAFTGVVGGSFNMQQAAAWNTLFAPYCEGSQNPITGNSKLLIIGGDQGCGIDYTNSPFVIGRSVAGSPIANANLMTGSGGFSFITPTDAGGLLMNWAGGKTLDTSIEHRFMGANTLTTYWDWVHTVGGTQAGTTQTLALYRGTNGSHTRIALLGPGVGGLNLFNDEGTSTRFNNATGSSGNIEFYSTGGGQLIFDFLSSGSAVYTPSANGVDVLSLKRFTDTSPTGNFENYKNAASASLWTVDITGKLTVGTMDAARVTSGAFAKAQQVATTMYTDQANTITVGKLTTLASATGGAGFNIPAGVAPTSPAIGDQWMVGANLFYRDNSGSPVTQTLEIQSNKNAANGYAGLDASTKLAAAQIPNPSASTLGGIQSITCGASNHIVSISTAGVPSCTADSASYPSLTTTETGLPTAPAASNVASALMSVSVNGGAASDVLVLRQNGGRATQIGGGVIQGVGTNGTSVSWYIDINGGTGLNSLNLFNGGITTQGHATLVGLDNFGAEGDLHGSNATATTGVTASNTTVEAGNATGATGANVGGDLGLSSGTVTSSSGTPGIVKMSQAALGAALTVGDLACISTTSRTISQCGASAKNAVGVVNATGNPNSFQFHGVATFNFNTSTAATAGDFLCTGANAGKVVENGTTACTAGQQVGIVWVTATAATVTAWIEFK